MKILSGEATLAPARNRKTLTKNTEKHCFSFDFISAILPTGQNWSQPIAIVRLAKT